MKRTSLFLDDKVVGQLQRLARRRGQSFAAVVREALAVYAAEPAGDATASPVVPAIAGRFRSGFTDTSARVDDLLWRDPHA